jgi:hypothetical protein
MVLIAVTALTSERALASCVRWGVAVVTTYNRYYSYTFIAVSLLKRLYNGRFNSETAVRRLQK